MVHPRAMRLTRLLLGFVLLALAATLMTIPLATQVGAQDDPHDPHEELDPVRELPLPCELLPVEQPSRNARNIDHVANICGIVGTDVEFQTRLDSTGAERDYAFVGTMGAGIRIFEITDPTQPRIAGGMLDPGWENDVQVAGDLMINAFDTAAGEPVSTVSPCMQLKYPEAEGQGADIFTLAYDPESGDFDINNPTCIPNPPGGAHNVTIHPSGDWLFISNCCSDWAADVIDLRPLFAEEPGEPVHRWRLIDQTTYEEDSPTCPLDATFACVVMERPTNPDALGYDETEVPCRGSEEECEINSAAGLWDPHDIFFSGPSTVHEGEVGERMYVAAIESTFIVNIEGILRSQPVVEETAAEPQIALPLVETISIIPNEMCPDGRLPENTRPGACADDFYEGDPPTGLDHVHNISINHQADITSDEAILVITDERGGGLTNDECVTDESNNGIIGSAHFWAVKPIAGIPETDDATEADPIFIGAYVNPNPGLTPETESLVEALALHGRSERGCTAHVFRLGGNGTAAPGPMRGPGDETGAFDGVSSLDNRQMVEAWYGAGVWWIDFSGPPDPITTAAEGEEDTIPEDARTSWGNTLGWNVMPASDAWSAKEYKGYIYTGDMTRGFDVFAFEPGFSVTPPPEASPGPSGTAEPSAPSGTDAAGGTTRPRNQIPNTATGPAIAVLFTSVIVVLVSVGGLVATRVRGRGAE